MASFPSMRPQNDGPTDVEPGALLRGASPARTAAAIAAAAAVFLAVVVLAGVGRLDTSMPGFLADELGPEKAGAPLERAPATGVGVRIHDQGYTVSHWGVSVSVVSEDVGGSQWRRHVHGVTRETEFGTETIVVNDRKTEAFLTVVERQGERTWRWKLASRLHPRLGRDGAVTFLDPTRHRVTSIAIDPVRILDRVGDDVTPEGLRWGLEEGDHGWLLTLDLDDADLPLPYVIDPAVTHRAATTATTTGATSLTLNVPAGVQPNDLLVAHIARVGNATINTPSGWSVAGGTNNGSFIRQATYYRVAGGTEPTSYTWTWTGTQPAAGGMSTYYGIKASAPLDAIGAATTANNTTTVTAASITTAANDALVLAFFSSNTNSTYSTATGMSERYEIGTTGAVSVASDDLTQAAAGATGGKTSTATSSGRVVGHQVSFNVDDVVPTGSVTDPGSPLAGTVVLTGNANDADSAVASVQFQRSPANAGTWTNIGAADTTSPYTASFDTTTVADGLYDLRVVVSDAAANVTNSTIVEDRRVDNTAPSSSTTFPASGETYGSAGWNAGCGAIGFCGTYSDAGSGVSQVQISIRRGSGDYWDGGSFSSASEVWTTTSIAAGNWSYAFAAGSFPADGGYTIRVRATDAAANVETPSSRTFTIDRDEPETTTDSNPADPTASTSASFTFSADEGGSTFECRLDGGAWGACTSPQGYAGLADGSHTFDVRATDPAGNTDSSPSTYTWLVDTTEPSTAVAFPAAGGEYNAAGWDAGCATAGLCGTYSDGAGAGVTQVQVSIRRGSGNYWDGSAFSSAGELWNTASLAAGAWSYAFDSSDFPADGGYTVRVRGVDAVANAATPSSRTFSYDTAAPQTTIDSNPADPTSSTSADFDFSSSESGSTFECRLDGGAWSACISPLSYSGLADGSHTFDVRATDAAGNTDGSPASYTWLVDTTAPSSTVSFPASSGEYNAAGWNAGCATSGTCGTDGDGSGSGVDRVEISVRRVSTGLFWNGASFSAAAETFFSASLSGGDWTRAFPASNFPADGDYTVRAFATDEVGNAETPSSRTFGFDASDPSGSLTAPADGAVLRGSSVTVSSDSADSGSGVASARFERRPAGGGTWTTIDTDTTTPYSVTWDTTPLADGDYDLRVLTTDDAGNTFTSPLRTLTVDNSAPSAPAVTLFESSPFAHASGSEIFVNADETGTYDVEAASSDAHSGIDKIRFPGPTDDSSSPYSASYGLGDLAGAQTVTAFNGAGLTASSPFTVTPDTAEPTGGSVDYPDGYDVDGDVTIAVDAGTDALSGLAAGSALLERRTAALADGGCDPFADAWSAVTSPDTVASGLCAQYRYRVSDRVGNEAVYASANVVQVDLVDPAAPVLTLDESSPFAHVVGTEIFLNTNESGSYDISASASDAVSGIDKVAFPGGVEDTSAPYAATYDFDDLLGTQTVTAHDRAGNTAGSGFEATEDVSAPSTTDDTASIGSAWQTAPVTVTLTPADARSGVATTYYTTDGSVPTTSSDEGTSIDLTADGDYVIRYFSVDNVGNAEPVRTAFATIRIDQTDPGTPAVSLDESSSFAHASGAEIFVNTNETGTYDVSATSSDAGSGIDKIVFPGGVEDTTSPYAATYDLDDLSGPEAVTAHDAAGNTASNTFTVTPDTAAPTGGSVDYPDGYDADGTVSIAVDAGADALSGVDAGSDVLERRTTTLSGGVCGPFVGGWSAVTSPDTVATGTCARYRYRVSDRVGNEAVYTLPTSTVKVDLVAPETTIDLAPGDPSSDASPSFEFSSSESGSTFECRLDGGAWSACTSPQGYAGLVDGSHTIQVRATDAAGVADATPASHTWTLDTAAPDTALDDVPADPSNDDAPSFEFSSSEPGSTYECRLDGGAWAACTSPETVGLLADGSHTFEARAADEAGNVDATPASYTWTVDTVAPDSSFSVVPADPTNDTTPTFEFSASEGGSTFECSLDGGAWNGCTSPVTTGALADGSHSFDVLATDPAGNQETTPESYTWVVDAGAPSVSIAQPSGFVNAADADPYTVRATSPDGDVTSVELFSCSDASAGCSGGSWISLGTDAVAPYEASWPVDADGNRALRAVATDVASNTGAAIVDVTIDRTVPATTIDSAPADPTSSPNATFAFSASEGGASFECRLGAGAWGPCSSPAAYSGLSEGSHTFHVRATDAAGNVDPTPATFGWTIESSAPETTIDVAPSDPSPSPAPSFEFSSSEPGSTFECRLDGGAWNACTSPQGYSGLADGSHTFQVRAADAAGNVDPSPAERTWTIDATPPGGGVADPGQYLRGTVALAASPTDTGAGVQSVDFQVSPADAGSWTSLGADTTDPYGLDWDTTLLADGLYDLRIVVTDGVGNSSPSAVVEDRIVDNTAPGATMNDPGPNLSGTVALTAGATDAGSGVATVAFKRSAAGAGAWTPVAASWNTTSVADGLYDLRVTVTDSAGNSTTSSPVANRRVDNTKPSLTASTPADGSTLTSAGSLQVVASEDVAGLVGATIDGAAAPAPAVSGNTVTYTQSFPAGPHTLAGELEDLAGNRQPIRVHFTTWSTSTADYPYVEKNSMPASSTSLRSTSDTATVTVPAGAWTGAPAGDWLVVRIDPQPAAAGSGGFAPAGEILDVTAYWALAGSSVTTFALPLEIEVDNTQADVIPATFEGGAWRPLAEVPGGSLPASWNDGFAFDGTNVRILTRHLSPFTLLEDVQAPTKPGGFKGTVKRGKFSLSWAAAGDNSGLISAYRVYANGTLVKTVGGSVRTVAMGAFKLTDRRSFQVAAVDEANNVGAKTGALKVVPKLAKLKLAAAKAALKKRGFKAAKITYKASSSVPKGNVIRGSASGLRPAGSKIGLTVSKGGSAAHRPITSAAASPPPPTPGTGFAATPPPPSGAQAPAPVPPATTPAVPVDEQTDSERGRVLPLVGTQVDGLADVRPELGLGLLAAAFSIAVAAVLRARRPAVTHQPADGDQLLLWDQRIFEAIRRFLRLG